MTARLRELVEALRAWFARHSQRDRAIMAAVVGAVLLSLVYVSVVEPLVEYRRGVAEEIADGQERLERAERFLAAADALRVEREDLGRRLAEAEALLLPGHSAALGAAALQDEANSVATEKGVTVQSTQVMRDEKDEPYHRVSVRLTLTGELRALAELIAGLEYGSHQLRLPFVELSRRGAVGSRKGPRPLSGTMEVAGYLRIGEEAGAGDEPTEDLHEELQVGPPAPKSS